MTDTTQTTDATQEQPAGVDFQPSENNPAAIVIGTFLIAGGRMMFSQSTDFEQAPAIIKSLTAIDIANLATAYANHVATPEDRQAFIDAQLAAGQGVTTPAPDAIQ